MNKKELNNCFKTIAPTDKQKDKMLSEIMINKGSVTMKTTTKTFSTIAVAAVICVLTASMALAATTFNWNDKFMELLKPSKNQVEQLTTSVENPEVKVTNNGVTIEVKQTVGDKNGIYILYDVEIPENITFKEEYTFKNQMITIGAGESSIGYSYSGRVLEESAHKRTYLSYLRADEGLQGKQIKMNIENIGYLVEGKPNTEWEFANIIEGVWTLDWVINNSAESKTFNVNKEVNTDKGIATLKDITISPFSIKINVLSEKSFGDVRFIIKLKDGSKMDNQSIEYAGGLSNDWLDGIQTIQSNFVKIIDINTIESIEFNGVDFPLN